MAWMTSKTGQIIWYIDRTYRVLPTLGCLVTYVTIYQWGKGYFLWLCNSHEQEHPDATARCDD